GRIAFPPDLYRRLVAISNRVYATLSIFGPVEALDAATGATLRTYPDTEKTEEIICESGVLFCVVAVTDPNSVDRRALGFQRTRPEPKRLVAVRADTGEILWSKQDDHTFAYQPLTLIAQDKRVFFQNASAIYCLEATTGKLLWRREQPSLYPRAAQSTPTLLVSDGVVLCADRYPTARGRAANGQLVALSAETGQPLWRCECAEGHSSPPEIFVINGEVWVSEVPAHKTLDFRTVRNLHTGKIIKQFGPADGWATWHHHRCYRAKATTRFLLTARTGVEFIDTTTGELTPHHWIRGICRYGVLPCNGLLYVPPDQCACYIQSKLHGFNALAPARKTPTRNRANEPRLETGTAYSEIPLPKFQIAQDDWPTFRRDTARSGYLPASIKPSLTQQWRTQLGSKPTSLVCAAEKLLLALPESHTVVCLHAETGKELWRFMADGRVDSPPTLARGHAVFGSRDGWVYALRATDGALAWRFRAAPENLQLVAYNQLESVWPVHGSTLVEGDAVYVAAGRNSYFDGGLWLYKLDLLSGKPLLTKRFYSRDEKTGLRVNLFPPFQGKVLPDRELPGLLPDIFSADPNYLYLRSVAVTRQLEATGTGDPHLFCSMGFLEDASWERTYWLSGTHMYGGARGGGAARTVEPAGRLLVFDDKQVFGFDDATSRLGPGLFAAAKVPKTKILPDTRRKTKRDARPTSQRQTAPVQDDEDAEPGQLLAQFPFDWRKKTTLNVRAMVLTRDLLFVAGPPRFDEKAAAAQLRARRTDDATLSPLLADAVASIEGKRGALLWAVNKTDGKRLTELKLDSAPVFDGMIAARGKLYISTVDGQVLCFGPKEPIP
ncbi:MAG: PQQ-binding-like beta-propeller repeat protein, partial [Verrucomicrobiae bacterium]|nr:PQQ-binding-like beta-propeller repeat protein [Verrucomicrobiae bacterium]